MWTGTVSMVTAGGLHTCAAFANYLKYLVPAEAAELHLIILPPEVNMASHENPCYKFPTFLKTGSLNKASPFFHSLTMFAF